MILLPRNLSAWFDLTLIMIVMLVLIGLLWQYNMILAAAAFTLWGVLVAFVRERCKDRSKKIEIYCENVIGSFNEMINYAIKNLPQAVLIVNEDARLEWCNKHTHDYADKMPGFWDTYNNDVDYLIFHGVSQEDIDDMKGYSTK